MIIIHVSDSKIDNILRTVELREKIRIESIRDYIIIHNLKNILDMQTEYTPKDNIEELIVKFLDLKYRDIRDIEEYRKIRITLQREVNDIEKLMLRIVPWKDAFKKLQKIYRKLIDGEIQNEELIYFSWIFTKYHLHSYARDIFLKYIENLDKIHNMHRIRIISYILFSILEMSKKPFDTISIKSNDFHKYFNWIIIQYNNNIITMFKGCDREYVLSNQYIVSEQARITISQNYTIKTIKEHTILIQEENNVKTIICATTDREINEIEIEYEKVNIKGPDIDYEDTNNKIRLIIPKNTLYIARGKITKP